MDYRVLTLLRAILLEYYKGIHQDLQQQDPPIPEGSFAASLLKKAIEEDKIESPKIESDKVYLLKLLGGKKTKKIQGYTFYREWRRRVGLDKTDHKELSVFLTMLYVDEFSRIVMVDDIPLYNIFGGENGTDVDVAVMRTNQKPLFPPDLVSLTEYLSKKLGCDPDKIDPVFFSVNTRSLPNGKIQKSFATDKGGKESINIVYHTYGSHEQEHPCFFTEEDLIPVHPTDQIYAIGKWVFDKMKKFLGHEEYKKLAKKKGDLYLKVEGRHFFSCEMMEKFDPNASFETRRLWKSFVMKMSQVVIYDRNRKAHLDKDTYIKSGMARIMSEYYPAMSVNFYDSLLYRDRLENKIPEWFVCKMVEIYHQHYMRLFPKIDPAKLIPLPWSIPNPTTLDDLIFEYWKESPGVVNGKFADEWLKEYGLEKIGLQFQEECRNVHLLEKKWPEIHVDTTAPRSVEWMRRYSEMYETGWNTGITHPKPGSTDREIIQHHSNLIGGNMGEAIVSSMLEKILSERYPDLLGIVTVGMISQGGPGTKAYCPDALAVFEKEIVPIEIKTFQSGPEIDATFYRGYSLARQQVLGAIRVLNEPYPEKPPAHFGLGVFLFLDVPGQLGAIHVDQFDYHEEELHFL